MCVWLRDEGKDRVESRRGELLDKKKIASGCNTAPGHVEPSEVEMGPDVPESVEGRTQIEAADGAEHVEHAEGLLAFGNAPEAASSDEDGLREGTGELSEHKAA